MFGKFESEQGKEFLNNKKIELVDKRQVFSGKRTANNYKKVKLSMMLFIQKCLKCKNVSTH